MCFKPPAWSLHSFLPSLRGQAAGRNQGATPAWPAVFHQAWQGRCEPCVPFVSGPFLQAPALKEEKTISQEEPWSPQRPPAPSQPLAPLHLLGQDSVQGRACFLIRKYSSAFKNKIIKKCQPAGAAKAGAFLAPDQAL